MLICLFSFLRTSFLVQQKKDVYSKTSTLLTPFLRNVNFNQTSKVLSIWQIPPAGVGGRSYQQGLGADPTSRGWGQIPPAGVEGRSHQQGLRAEPTSRGWGQIPPAGVGGRSHQLGADPTSRVHCPISVDVLMCSMASTDIVLARVKHRRPLYKRV